MADGSKTEKATPKKRRDERKKGNVFLSKDAITVVTLLASYFTLIALADFMGEQLTGFFQLCFYYMGRTDVGQVQGFLSEVVTQGLLVVAKTAGIMLMATVVAAVAGTFAQTRFLVAGDSIKPKFSRMSPIEGFKKLFSMRSVVEAIKGILKITILLLILYNYLSGMINTLANYMQADIVGACAHLFEQTMGMVLQIIMAYIALAGFDFLYQWWDYERQLKMSKQEIKEEYKQMEGDPQIKGKIKEAQRKMAQQRMMQQVPSADVIIRNPTHFAVALRYKPDVDPAPLVLAKGMDEVALRIVQVAERHNIAVIENVPLARSLYAEGELNREIPAALYGAVAEVLVYLYRLGGQGK